MYGNPDPPRREIFLKVQPSKKHRDSPLRSIQHCAKFQFSLAFCVRKFSSLRGLLYVDVTVQIANVSLNSPQWKICSRDAVYFKITLWAVLFYGISVFYSLGVEMTESPKTISNSAFTFNSVEVTPNMEKRRVRRSISDFAPMHNPRCERADLYCWTKFGWDRCSSFDCSALAAQEYT